MPTTETTGADYADDKFEYPDDEELSETVTEPEQTEEAPAVVPETPSPQEEEEGTEETTEEAPEAEPEPELSGEDLQADYARLKSEVGRNGQQLGEAKKHLIALGYTFDEKGLPIAPAQIAAQPQQQQPRQPVAPTQPQTPVDAFLAAQPNPDDLDLDFNPWEAWNQDHPDQWPRDKFGEPIYEPEAFIDEDTEQVNVAQYLKWQSDYNKKYSSYERQAEKRFGQIKQQREAAVQAVQAEEQRVTSELETHVYAGLPEAQRRQAVELHKQQAREIVKRYGGDPSQPDALYIGTAIAFYDAVVAANAAGVLQTSVKPAPVAPTGRPATMKFAPKTPVPVEGSTGSTPVGAGAARARSSSNGNGGDAKFNAPTFEYDEE